MGLSLGQFLAHTTNAGGGRFLKGWKEKPGWVEFWLSLVADFYPNWHHPFYAPGSYEKDGKIIPTLEFPKPTCTESEAVCKSQFFTNDADTGRQLPPQSCSFCKLKDWLRWSPAAQSIPLDTIIFRWNRPQSDNRTRSSGPIEWRRGFLSGLEKRGANYDESLDAKLQYLFIVAQNPPDNAKPDEEIPLVIAPATKSLGDGMKTLIGDRIRAKGEEDGNPLVRPVCFRWEFYPNETPQRMYKVLAWEKAPLTDAILTAIKRKDYPSVNAVIEPTDPATLKAMFEVAAEAAGSADLLPWDYLFPRRAPKPATDSGMGAATKPPGTTAAQERAAGRTPDVRSAPTPQSQQAKAPPPVKSKRRIIEEPKPEPVVEMLPCEKCNTPFPADATVCPHCGQTYKVEDDGPASSSVKDDDIIASGAACWSCEKERPRTPDNCPHCGVTADNESDDLPF